MGRTRKVQGVQEGTVGSDRRKASYPFGSDLGVACVQYTVHLSSPLHAVSAQAEQLSVPHCTSKAQHTKLGAVDQGGSQEGCSTSCHLCLC